MATAMLAVLAVLGCTNATTGPAGAPDVDTPIPRPSPTSDVAAFVAMLDAAAQQTPTWSMQVTYDMVYVEQEFNTAARGVVDRQDGLRAHLTGAWHGALNMEHMVDQGRLYTNYAPYYVGRDMWVDQTSMSGEDPKLPYFGFVGLITAPSRVFELDAGLTSAVPNVSSQGDWTDPTTWHLRHDIPESPVMATMIREALPILDAPATSPTVAVSDLTFSPSGYVTELSTSVSVDGVLILTVEVVYDEWGAPVEIPERARTITWQEVVDTWDLEVG